jgi:hypothetical protein
MRGGGRMHVRKRGRIARYGAAALAATALLAAATAADAAIIYTNPDPDIVLGSSGFVLLDVDHNAVFDYTLLAATVLSERSRRSRRE